MTARLEEPRAARWQGILSTARGAYRGELPERYWGYPATFRAPFDTLLRQAVGPDQRILDVGGGRSPTLPPTARPPGSRYVGLDIDSLELDRAPEGSYDEIVVGDITKAEPRLTASFDLILSFQVLEHVKDLNQAFANMHLYLRPGGQMVIQLSGTFSVYGLLNRVTPQTVCHRLQQLLYKRAPETVFPAHYHHCYFTALERMTRSWSSAEIMPLWIAEPYVHFSPALRSTYIAFEEWARRAGRKNLAPYYLVRATR